MLGDQTRDDGVENTFRHFVSVRIKHSIRLHQMPYVTHEHERASGQRKRASIRLHISPVAMQFARHHFAVFFKRGCQIPFHQSEPGTVHDRFIVSIDGSDRIFAVHNRRQRRLHDDIFNPGRIGFTDRVFAIDAQLHVQPVVFQQNRFPALPCFRYNRQAGSRPPVPLPRLLS